MSSEKLTDCQRLRLRMLALAQVIRENKHNGVVAMRALVRLHGLADQYRAMREDA